MTIKEKYYSINQSNLSNEQITFLKKIKDLTNDFETTDSAVLNKAESALDKIINVINLKQPEALKQEKEVVEIKQPEVSKQTKKVVKTKKPVNKRKSSSTTTQKKPTIFSKAKEIRKEGESWESAKARATKMIKGEKEEVVKVMNSELKSLLQVVRRRKELKAKYGKKSYELGGAFMNTDLAGHSGGGTGGLNTGMPLSGTSGTYYTGLVGETGAMSSGELFENGGGIEKTTKVEGIKNAMYKTFQSYLNEEISGERLVSILNRVLGKRKWFRYFQGDTGASDVRSIESALNSRVNKEGEKESMQIAIDTKGLQIYNWDGDEIFEAGGAMSSGEMFKKGGELPKLSELIEEKNGTTVNFYQEYGNIKFHTQVFKTGDLYQVYQGGSNLGMWGFYNQKFKNRNEAINFAKDSLKKQIEEYIAYYTTPKNIKDYVGKHFIYAHNVYYIGGLRKNAVKQYQRSERTGKIVDISGQYNPSFVVLEIEIDNTLSPYDTNQKVVKGSVLHIIDLDDFKKKKYYHISSKKLPSKIQEQIDSKKAYFERFEGKKYEAGGAMMQNQQVINDASQPYVITEAFGNPAQQLGMLAKGGSIENQYEGRTPEDVWNNWTVSQKEHFVQDHFLVLSITKPQFSKWFEGFSKNAKNNDKYDSLSHILKTYIDDHIKEGQYASGGSLGKALYVENSSWFVSNKYDEEKIMSVLESIGAKNIRLENDRGWSNQPEVVVFNGDKNKAVDALNEAFDTVWIRVSEKDWRTKKMANGGSFAPNVSDGTQFMSDVYAKGGSVGDIIYKDDNLTIQKYHYETMPNFVSFKITYLDNGKNKSWYVDSNLGGDWPKKYYDTEVEEKIIKILKNHLGDNYANGGSFAPNVSNGTQFMNNVYAKGGSVGDIIYKDDNLTISIANKFTPDFIEFKVVYLNDENMQTWYVDNNFGGSTPEEYHDTQVEEKIIQAIKDYLGDDYANGGSFAPNVSNGTQFMSDVYAKGGDVEDYYEQLAVYVQGVGSIYNGTSMKKALVKANSYLKNNPKAEIAIVDEKYGDEYDFDGNLKEDYVNGGSFAPNVSNGTQFMSDVYASGGSFVDGGRMDYWEDYHEDSKKIQNPTDMQIEQEVEACVEFWNDNNEMGEENEVNDEGEKIVIKLAKEFAKAKGYISSDIIDAMIAQETYAEGGSLPYLTDNNFGNFQNTGAFGDGGEVIKVLKNK